MTHITDNLRIDHIPIVRLENALLQVDIAPEVGGKIVSLVEKRTGHEFLWRNEALRLVRLPPGAEFDPNFYGGIDDLIPNDYPETVDGVPYPDHGELWTTPMAHRVEGEELILEATLPHAKLNYTKRVHLRQDRPFVDLDYRIENLSGAVRRFMWKLHAALRVEPGDAIVCPARTARVADLQWSRWHTLEPFAWPVIEGNWADEIPPADGTCDFFYLYDLEAGRISWESAARGLRFGLEFDTGVFPFTWLFASYGGLLGYYTVVLEPCSGMPISVNEAAEAGHCTRLEPGQSLETSISMYAGPL
jgi:hypothetical protein